MYDENDTAYRLKLAVRGLIFAGDPVLRENLTTGTQILHSKKYPTQAFNLKFTKYIRVNTEDIAKLSDQGLEDLLKFLLSSKGYYGNETPEETKEDVLTNATKYYKESVGEDLTESELVEVDDFGNIVNAKEFPLTFKDFGSKDKTEEEKDKSEQEEKDETASDDNITKVVQDIAKSAGMIEPVENITKEPVIPESEKQEVEQALKSITTFKDKSVFNSNRSILSFDEIRILNRIAKRLLQAFKGHKSKQKTITPKKHINSKSLAIDSDKFYIDTKAPKGKYIDFNLLIDMSGSMGGNPIKNAVSLVYIFNKLAQQGHINGHIIYSQSSKNFVVKFGVEDGLILGLNKTNNSEGLADTIDANVDILKYKNCICITDGELCDSPISKEFWRKHKIVATGVYINKNMKNPLDYSDSLNKWFDRSLVRATIEDMVQLLVKIGIKG